jgi:hypothetical protein
VVCKDGGGTEVRLKVPVLREANGNGHGAGGPAAPGGSGPGAGAAPAADERTMQG